MSAAVSFARGVDGCKPGFSRNIDLKGFIMNKLLTRAGLVGSLATLPALSFAQAADPVADIFAAIDLSTVGVAVGVVGIAVIAIVMAFKAIDLGKRGVSKV